MTRALFIIDGLIALAFGIGLIAAPAALLGLYGLVPDVGAVLLARLLGASLLGHGGILWLARNRDDATVVAIVRGHWLFDISGAAVSLMAMVSGTLNVMGWSFVALFTTLCVLRTRIGFARGTRPPGRDESPETRAEAQAARSAAR